jgi:hypothetical protein
MREPVYRVLLDDWQLQCCGEPFAVGDEVAWRLMLVTHTSDPDKFRVTLTGSAADVHGEAARVRAVRAGGLTAMIPSDSHPPFSGVLFEDHHADVPSWLPATHGTVVRMFLGWQERAFRAGELCGVPGHASAEARTWTAKSTAGPIS